MIGRANPLTSTSSPSLDSGTHAAATGDASDREPFGQTTMQINVTEAMSVTLPISKQRGIESDCLNRLPGLGAPVLPLITREGTATGTPEAGPSSPRGSSICLGDSLNVLVPVQ